MRHEHDQEDAGGVHHEDGGQPQGRGRLQRARRALLAANCLGGTGEILLSFFLYLVAIADSRAVPSARLGSRPPPTARLCCTPETAFSSLRCSTTGDPRTSTMSMLMPTTDLAIGDRASQRGSMTVEVSACSIPSLLRMLTLSSLDRHDLLLRFPRRQGRAA
jgi:hypothetical protein